MDYNELIAAFEKLDRSEFLDDELKQYADLDEPLPIGYGQTISQPSLVVRMTYLLEPEKDSKVLEIGTGSGYQTALLSGFSGHVFTVERIPKLADAAKERLGRLGYSNISYKIADGSLGWRENAPYDRIIVTAAAGEVPAELIEQLKSGGRLVIPVGSREMQELKLVTKDLNGEISYKTISYVRFVELKGKYGWK